MMKIPEVNVAGSELGKIKQSVIDGDMIAVKKLTAKALEQGAKPLQVFREALVPAMDVVGERMRSGEYFIPEVLLAARAMKSAAEIVKPLIVKSRVYEPSGTVVIGTVYGDMHDIGKNVVAMMLEGAGFEVVDLGVDVSVQTFVETVKERRADVLALSALLTTTMGHMEEVLKALETAGVRRQVKVIVGGAPLSERFASEISADGYAEDAGAAVDLARNLITARRPV